MKLIFLGSGSAFTVGENNFHSNVLFVSEQGKKLLLDCGSDIRFSLQVAGFSYLDITDIYISHLHSDHAGGLEYIGLSTKFDNRCAKPNLYLSQDIAADIWDRTLSGGLSYIEGDIANLQTFFSVYPLKKNSSFFWEGIQFYLVKVNHINNGFTWMPTYGLFFSINEQKIFFTGDTKLSFGELQEYYERADVIFHDCEIANSPTLVHAHYEELTILPANIKQKMWLYGYQPGELPDAKQDGFLGFVERGQSFEF